jgi:hypothetical protein
MDTPDSELQPQHHSEDGMEKGKIQKERNPGDQRRIVVREA